MRWAEKQLEKQQTPAKDNDTERQLLRLYQQSVQQSGVQIVPGDSLTWYQRSANFVQANPLKVVLGMAVPSVAWIFYGRTGKEHLQLSMKLLHTRVFGQFATLSCKCVMVVLYGAGSCGTFKKDAKKDAETLLVCGVIETG